MFMKSLLVLSIVFWLAGCSTNRDQQGYFESFYQAYLSVKQQQNTLDKKTSESMSFASLNVWIDQKGPSLMPLGELKLDSQLWFSRNSFGLRTQDARIIQFFSPESEISAVRMGAMLERYKLSNIELGDQAELTAKLDLSSHNQFDVEVNLYINAEGYEKRQLWGESVSLLRIVETVSIPAWNFNSKNYYWKDSNTGFVWESVQKWGPMVSEVHYQVVKPWQTVLYP
jgi:uncharacterized protein YceK